MRRSRASVLLGAALLGAATLAATGPSAGAAATSPPGSVHIDPSLPVHPALQYGAQVDPDKKVRVIVQKDSPDRDANEIAASAGTSVDEEFAFVHSAVLEIPQKDVLKLARNPHVRFVSPDGLVKHHGGGGGSTSTSTSTSTTTAIDISKLLTTYPLGSTANKVWNDTTGLAATGLGVTVAVIDTGITLPSSGDISGSRVTSINLNKTATTTTDGYGHGTHVAGIIAAHSSGNAYLGTAPDANIISIKISDDAGVGHASDMLRGLQWVYDNRATYNIKVVNISSSVGTAESYKTSVVDAAVEQLWLNGITVVVAAGNKGTAVDAVSYAPANDPYVITVGCLDDNLTATLYTDDSICTFSSRGTTQDGYQKPDLVAPGRRVVSTLAGTTSVLATLLPTHITSDSHLRLSGTSMAAPVVTGTVALLLQRLPSLTPNQIKGVLQYTARNYPGQAKGDPAGEVNAYAAVSNAVSGQKYTVANAGLVPNNGINTTTNTVMWGSYYLDASYWDSYYLDSYYLDVTTYD